MWFSNAGSHKFAWCLFVVLIAIDAPELNVKNQPWTKSSHSAPDLDVWREWRPWRGEEDYVAEISSILRQEECDRIVNRDVAWCPFCREFFEKLLLKKDIFRFRFSDSKSIFPISESWLEGTNFCNWFLMICQSQVYRYDRFWLLPLMKSLGCVWDMNYQVDSVLLIIFDLVRRCTSFWWETPIFSNI